MTAAFAALLLFLWACLAAESASSVNYTEPYCWNRTEHLHATAVALDSAGSFLLAGGTTGPLIDEEDALVVKVSPDGGRVWATARGSSQRDTAVAVVSSVAGDVFAAGVTRGGLDGSASAGDEDAFLMRLSPDGAWIWTAQLGSAQLDRPTALALSSAGDDVVLVGYTLGGLAGHSNAGAKDLFLAKCSPEGAWAWTLQRGTTGVDYPASLVVSMQGDIFITGHTYGGLDGHTNAGRSDVFLMGVGAGGEWQWTAQRGSAQSDVGEALAVSNSTGEIFVAGYTLGSLDGNNNSGLSDIFLMKFSPTGAWAWTAQSGSAWSRYPAEYASAVALSPAGDGIFVAGRTAGNLFGVDSDAFVVGFTLAGAVTSWTQLKQHGPYHPGIAHAIVVAGAEVGPGEVAAVVGRRAVSASEDCLFVASVVAGEGDASTTASMDSGTTRSMTAPTSLTIEVTRVDFGLQATLGTLAIRDSSGSLLFSCDTLEPPRECSLEDCTGRTPKGTHPAAVVEVPADPRLGMAVLLRETYPQNNVLIHGGWNATDVLCCILVGTRASSQLQLEEGSSAPALQSILAHVSDVQELVVTITADACDETLGTCDWYLECLRERHEDCDRNESYAINYGHWYCMQHSWKYQHFSWYGKQWVDAVRECLQSALISMPWYTDPATSGAASCIEIEEAAFESHSECYVSPSPTSPFSFCSLQAEDLTLVLASMLPAFKTWQTPQLSRLAEQMERTTKLCGWSLQAVGSIGLEIATTGVAIATDTLLQESLSRVLCGKLGLLSTTWDPAQGLASRLFCDFQLTTTTSDASASTAQQRRLQSSGSAREVSVEYRVLTTPTAAQTTMDTLSDEAAMAAALSETPGVRLVNLSTPAIVSLDNGSIGVLSAEEFLTEASHEATPTSASNAVVLASSLGFVVFSPSTGEMACWGVAAHEESADGVGPLECPNLNASELDAIVMTRVPFRVVHSYVAVARSGSSGSTCFGHGSAQNCHGVDFTGMTDFYAAGNAVLAYDAATGRGVCWGDGASGGACGDVPFAPGMEIHASTDGFVALWRNVSSPSLEVESGLCWPSDQGCSNVDFAQTSSLHFNKCGAVALKAELGAAVCWGCHECVNVNFTGTTDIIANDAAFVALKADGSITCWGNSSYGGDCAHVSLLGITDVYATGHAFLALARGAGSGVCWGRNTSGGECSHVDFEGVSEVHATRFAFLALRPALGTASCWGAADFGGNCTHVNFTGATAVYITHGAFLALKPQQGLGTCWGGSILGGDCSHVDFTNVVEVHSNWYAFFAVRANASAVCWGQPMFGGDCSHIDFTPILS